MAKVLENRWHTTCESLFPKTARSVPRNGSHVGAASNLPCNDWLIEQFKDPAAPPRPLRFPPR
jgi:hypothetical protein